MDTMGKPTVESMRHAIEEFRTYLRHERGYREKRMRRMEGGGPASKNAYGRLAEINDVINEFEATFGLEVYYEPGPRIEAAQEPFRMSIEKIMLDHANTQEVGRPSSQQWSWDGEFDVEIREPWGPTVHRGVARAEQRIIRLLTPVDIETGKVYEMVLTDWRGAQHVLRITTEIPNEQS